MSEIDLASLGVQAALQLPDKSTRRLPDQPQIAFETVLDTDPTHDVSARLNDSVSPLDRPVALENQPTQIQKLDHFVQGILDDDVNIKAMMQRCLNGEDMSQQELLQMQALIYSYTQKIELSSKVVEKFIGGIKQIMNTQV